MDQQVRIVGRLDALAARPRRVGEQRLDEVASTWSLATNAAWLDDGVRRGAIFRQTCQAAPGSVLRWELARLWAQGHVAIGPFWVPRDWLRRRALYRLVLALVAGHVRDTSERRADGFEAKCSAELQPLIDLWPHLLLVPTRRVLGVEALIRMRAAPVRALGLVDRATWADGGLRSPAEFFFHDLDHARFQLREDLLARGVQVPDAYVDGSTFDARTGRHRTFVAAATPHVDGHGCRHAGSRRAFADRLLAACARRNDRDLGTAMRWLLFELVHEKSLPLVPVVLADELASPRHVGKLQDKCAAGFYGMSTPPPAVLGRLRAARYVLREAIVRERA